jgi:acyl-CoA reductase-like NAD-dependent aldehyde dehydrogenase
LLFPRFLDAFAERARRLKLGPALDYSVDMGSLASERQMRMVEQHVSDALERGATIAAGGRRRPDLGPLFYEPTILTGVRPDMRVYAEETFGPVVSVYPFDDEEEAVRLANHSRFGLSASIWTKDTARGVAIARRIDAGSININEAYAATWGSTDAPIGGVKESGLRPRHGDEGLLKYTEPRTVAIQRWIPLGPRPGRAAAYARAMTALVRLVRRTRLFG